MNASVTDFERSRSSTSTRGSRITAAQISTFVLMLAVHQIAGAQVSEIIDGTGDGSGNVLTQPEGIAADGLGNIYVAGKASVNAFKISSGGTITELLDSSGDGSGNALASPEGIAVDGSGNVYLPVAEIRSRERNLTREIPA